MLTSQSFTLPAGQSAEFLVRGTLTNTNATVNQAYASHIMNGNTSNTVVDIVNQTPEVIPPVLSLTKEVKNITDNTAFIQADSVSSALSVDDGDTIQYKLTVSKVS